MCGPPIFYYQFFLQLQDSYCPYSYHNISDSWRKVGSAQGELCDSGNGIASIKGTEASKLMDGNNWFRFIEPAGTKLSTIDIGPSACTTSMSGWMDGPEPTSFGQSINNRVCFSWWKDGKRDKCKYEIDTKVALCRENGNDPFYIYQLKNLPWCRSLYCAISG